MKRSVTRRTLFAGAAAAVASVFAGKWFVDRTVGTGEPAETGWMTPDSPGFIDVRQFKSTMTVESLNDTAEAYFAGAKDWDYFLAKPLAYVSDCPALLNNISHLLRGLELVPGMTVLDFGAASCWLSRWLTQLGMQVIALDVSETALKMGRQIYQRLPIIGERPAPRFLRFDGHRIALPDASVDRILVLDTYHHLLNPDAVLREMARILKPDGIAGFSEPGPRHSRGPGAQFEMRNFKVLEDDVDIHRVWDLARQAGFQRLRVAVINSQPMLLSLAEFDEFLDGGESTRAFTELTRKDMQDRRIFFLHRTAHPPTYDSRGTVGLKAKIEVRLPSASAKAGVPLKAQALVKNTGTATWLPSSAERGGVWLGARLLDRSGQMLDVVFLRHPLTPGSGRPIKPGETVNLDLVIPPLTKGAYVLEFDVLVEGRWFSYSGTESVRARIEVD